MKILIAGGSGFIGKALTQAWQHTHEITIIGRNKAKLMREFTSPITTGTWEELESINAQDFDVVINLSGYNIGAARWNPKLKQKIIDSRVQTTHVLSQWMMSQQAKPHFISANAVGIYGLQANGDLTVCDEDTSIDMTHPSDFMSEIGIRWQAALQPAVDAGIPVTVARFGVVLQKKQGMLKKLAPSFYLGLGSVIGEGTQIISWIHIDDLVGALTFLMQNRNILGPVNLCSPQPVSQAQFAKILATTLHRPLFLKLPAAVIHLLFGEMGDCLLLKGQRVLPKRLLIAGYEFRYPALASALQHEFR